MKKSSMLNSCNSLFSVHWCSTSSMFEIQEMAVHFKASNLNWYSPREAVQYNSSEFINWLSHLLFLAEKRLWDLFNYLFKGEEDFLYIIYLRTLYIGFVVIKKQNSLCVESKVNDSLSVLLWNKQTKMNAAWSLYFLKHIQVADSYTIRDVL